MNEQELRHLKSKSQRLDTLLSEFQEDVELLHDSGVDVSMETDVAERQDELQDEMEQLASDILLLLDTSGTVDRDGGTKIGLPNPQRNPVSSGTLPDPTFDRPDGRGNPAWSNGNNGGGN